jgi:uncharacterized protein YmfQ (DUF2313 family)
MLALSAPLVYADEVPSWEQGQAELQQALVKGQERGFFDSKLRELGYQITAINYNDEDYIEYEVVKGENTYEVQIDIDDETQKATEIEIDPNVWKTEATERALTRNSRLAPASDAAVNEHGMPYGYRYSDRDRSRVEQMVKDLETLPIGQDKAFYKTELKNRGYEITKVNEDTPETLDLEAVKNARSVAFEATFNEETGQSTELDVSELWWESDATEKAREQQEGKTAQAAEPSSHQ